MLIGQPDFEAQHIDNPVRVNKVLSFLIYGTTTAEVKGLDAFPRDQWPTTLPLLFYSYHIMAGLGTYFAAADDVAVLLLWRGQALPRRWILWPMLLSFPLAYIANTAGWMTAEIGRQPWLVYGLLRTAHGYSNSHRRRHQPVHAARLFGHVQRAVDSLGRDRLYHHPNRAGLASARPSPWRIGLRQTKES